MKLLIFIALLLPSICFGQDWKEYCVTYKGDTVTKYDSIKILPVGAEKAFEVLRPRMEYKGELWLKYRDRIPFMLNNTYAIDALSRLPIDRKKGLYQPLIIIRDMHAGMANGVLYTIRLDDALKAGVVEIVKP